MFRLLFSSVLLFQLTSVFQSVSTQFSEKHSYFFSTSELCSETQYRLQKPFCLDDLLKKLTTLLRQNWPLLTSPLAEKRCFNTDYVRRTHFTVVKKSDFLPKFPKQ